MGRIRNETIVVSSWGAEKALQAHEAACCCFDTHGMGRLVSGLTLHATNGGAAFFISPDGSKEGWDTSCRGTAARDEFIAWMKHKDQAELYLDWALIVLGGDECEFSVTDSAAA